ncbi:hypothetical protein FB451DRAFT_1399473 [Mycena latifolia]|nr:hypothetical protein FB451DRAFT_1399473 [Mycena latifolia]
MDTTLSRASLVLRFPQELMDRVIEENNTDIPASPHSFVDLSCAPPKHASSRASNSSWGRRHPDHISAVSDYTKFYGPPDISRWGMLAWVATDPSLIAVLMMLDALTSFESLAEWPELPKELRAAICGLCARSRLVKLGLVGLGKITQMDEFASLIASPALENLSLRNIELPLLDECSGAVQNQLRLTFCDLRVAGPTLPILMRWLTPPDAFATVRQLHLIWAPPRNTPDIQRIIDASVSSLKKLFLTISQGLIAPYTLTPLVLVKLPALRFLNLTLLFPDEESAALTPWLAGNTGARTTYIASNVWGLTEIVIEMFLTTTPTPVPIAAIEWAPLARALEPAHFPALKRLKLDIVALSSQLEELLGVILDEAKRGLQALRDRGA